MDRNDISWQYRTADETVKELSSNESRGLKESAVSHRLAAFGANDLWHVGRVSLRSIAVKYLLDGAFIFLLADLLCAAFVGFDLQFTLILALTVAFVAFRVVCDVILARLARKGAESLVPEALVIREGRAKTLAATALVPGDIVILKQGDLVPADLRVISAESLGVSEKGVTDNDIPVEKTANALIRRPSANEPENMSNMLFAFSYVLSGTCRAVVAATGDLTLASKKGLKKNIEPKTDSTRMKKAERVAALSSSVLMAAALVYVFIGLFAFRGKFGVTQIFLGALSFAVAGYGTLWHSLILYAHSRRTARLFRAGVRLRMPDAPDLSDECAALVVRDVSALTDGKPSVCAVVTCGKVVANEALDRKDDAVSELMKMLALVSGTAAGAVSACGGSFDDGLADGAVRDHLRRTKGKLSALTANATIAGRAVKSADNALDTVMYAENGEYHAVCAGDIDSVLAVCRTVILDGFEETLSRERISRYSAMARELEERGCRVIALAHRIPPTQNFSHLAVIQHSMGFAGFVALSPTAAPKTRELVEGFLSPERSILCFASRRSDACFAASKDVLDTASIYTVRDVREANAVPLEKGKSTVVCVPDDLLTPEEGTRLRLILVRRLKKSVGDVVCAGNSLADGTFVREAKLRLLLESPDRLRPAPYSISNCAHAVLTSDGAALPCEASVELLRPSNVERRLELVRKYLIGSQLARAALLVATLFLPPVIPAVTYLLWAFVVDGAVSVFLTYSKGVGDYVARPLKPRKADAKDRLFSAENGEKSTAEEND